MDDTTAFVATEEFEDRALLRFQIEEKTESLKSLEKTRKKVCKLAQGKDGVQRTIAQERLCDVEQKIERTRQELAALERSSERRTEHVVHREKELLGKLHAVSSVAKTPDNCAEKFAADFECAARELREKYAIAEGDILHAIAADVRSPRVRGVSVPFFLWDMLFPYQRDGVRWLLSLYARNEGGILADDMGLGKTMQMICFLASLLCSGQIQRVLIVTTLTLIDQWVCEVKTVFPLVRTVVVSTRTDASVLAEVFAHGGFCIVSYSSVVQLLEKLNREEWCSFVLDEGHKIKNPNTLITRSCSTIRTRSRYILSATPLQNNMNELWCLFNFINPMLLGTFQEFEKEFYEKIKPGLYMSATREQIGQSRAVSSVLKEKIVRNILVRTKDIIAGSLPKKQEQIIFVRLTPLQREHYIRAINSRLVEKILSEKISLFNGIDILRKICNHPFLLKRKTASFRDHDVRDIVSASAKLKTLVDMVCTWRNDGDRALVFSQTRQMLDIIEYVLEKTGTKYLRMDGLVKKDDRKKLIEEFSCCEDYTVFLLTTRTGGLGLNLTCANRVVIFDPDWNPSTDIQAKERSWRIGQERSVQIYRFICSGTIEERICTQQVYKTYLARKILGKSTKTLLFRKSSLEDMFSLFDSRAGVLENVDIGDKQPEQAISDYRDAVAAADTVFADALLQKRCPAVSVLNYIRMREKGDNIYAVHIHSRLSHGTFYAAEDLARIFGDVVANSTDVQVFCAALVRNTSFSAAESLWSLRRA